jgi:hypothetical protein
MFISRDSAGTHGGGTKSSDTNANEWPDRGAEMAEMAKLQHLYSMFPGAPTDSLDAVLETQKTTMSLWQAFKFVR